MACEFARGQPLRKYVLFAEIEGIPDPQLTFKNQNVQNPMLIDELVPGCSGFLHGFILYILGIVWNCHNP